MTRKDALTELIAKVEAGEWARDMTGPKPLDPRGMTFAALAYEGSLDAAKALHEAVLPGWSPSIGQNVHHKYWFATVIRAEMGTIVADASASLTTPARAWLLAILRALYNMEPET